MPEIPTKKPPRIPPQGRGVILALSPLIVAYGLWVVVTRRVGRGPTPIEGPAAVVLGLLFILFAATLFAIAWAERRSADPDRSLNLGGGSSRKQP